MSNQLPITTGDTGEHVSNAQFMLRRVGYSIFVTGTLTDKCVRSIRRFQSDLKLPTTGEIDNPTFEKLERCFRNVSRTAV